MNATAAVALTTCTAIWDGTGATIAATSHRNSPARCADVSSVADPIWGPMRCGVIASRLLQWTFNERIESNRLKTCAFLPLHLSLSLSLSLLSLFSFSLLYSISCYYHSFFPPYFYIKKSVFFLRTPLWRFISFFLIFFCLHIDVGVYFVFLSLSTQTWNWNWSEFLMPFYCEKKIKQSPPSHLPPHKLLLLPPHSFFL